MTLIKANTVLLWSSRLLFDVSRLWEVINKSLYGLNNGSYDDDDDVVAEGLFYFSKNKGTLNYWALGPMGIFLVIERSKQCAVPRKVTSK